MLLFFYSPEYIVVTLLLSPLVTLYAKENMK